MLPTTAPEAKKTEEPKQPLPGETQPEIQPAVDTEVSHVKTACKEAKCSIHDNTSEKTSALATEQKCDTVQEKIKEKLPETVKDLKEMNIDELFALEAQYQGILFYAFTDFANGTTKLEFEKWDEWYKEPKEGEKLTVDFLGNQEAYDKLGAGDILPPSVRKITVLEDGKEERKRESTRRIGLKGKNDNSQPNGFFDAEGYIPVFTGDVIVIGAPDKTFDKYIKPDRTLDYDAYNADQKEQIKKDKEFLGTLEPGQKSKQPSPEEIAALIAGAEGKGKKIVEAVRNLVGKPGSSCWDWVNQVYNSTSPKMRPQRIYQDLNYSGKRCGDHHASPELMKKIQPGDWLYINNKNRHDPNGCHSCIFLGWVGDSANQIAQIASCPGAGRRGRIDEKCNLKKNPVTYIAKPV
ncbi:MAG: hypothetical protein WCT46_01315 [Candidatus Gracilibacteria bacterium]